MDPKCVLGLMVYLNDIFERDDADSTACKTWGFADQKEMSSTRLATFLFQ